MSSMCIPANPRHALFATWNRSGRGRFNSCLCEIASLHNSSRQWSGVSGSTHNGVHEHRQNLFALLVSSKQWSGGGGSNLAGGGGR